MLGGIGTWEILRVFLVALLLFGARRIPEIAKGLGKGITEFRRAVRDVKEEIETSVDTTPTPPPSEGTTSATEAPPSSADRSPPEPTSTDSGASASTKAES